MGAINIPDAVKQMDGVFGYKVVKTKNSDGTEDFAVKKKDIFDRIFDIIFNLESHPQSRQKTIAAFRKIAEQIEGTDNGEFKALTEKYADGNEPIDYRKIREALKAALEYYPPRVYSRAATNANSAQVTDDAASIDFHKMYLQNIRKSACNGDEEVTIFRGKPNEVVTDENLEALADALFEHYRNGKQEVWIVESDFRISTRMELMRYRRLQEMGATFQMDLALRIEILEYRLELIKSNPSISVREIRQKTNETFKACRAYVEAELKKLHKPAQ